MSSSLPSSNSKQDDDLYESIKNNDKEIKRLIETYKSIDMKKSENNEKK